MTIFTVGYEGMSIDAFVALLQQQGVETVVDIREYPLSRKPGFSKTALAENLRAGGIEYVHIAALGCPKPVRNAYKEDGDWRRYRAGFLKYLKTQDETIAELSDMAGASRCALLCFEADYNYCHRSFVADAVRAFSGAGVRHLWAQQLRKARAGDLQPALV